MPRPVPGPIRLSMTAGVDAPYAARQALEALSGRIDDELLETARLIVTELVTNSVHHAPPGEDGEVDMSVSPYPDCLRIEVIDGGNGFKPETPELSPVQTSGWGLWLVEQLTDRWGIDHHHSTRVWCEIDF
jgi:anti-sigma regulatory factor (Ser/Thr protein kinase)